MNSKLPRSSGTHACLFFVEKRDLLEILAPYFYDGMEDNAYCLWVLPDLLNKNETVNALCEIISGIGRYFKSGQLDILSPEDMISREGDWQNILSCLLSKITQAIERGSKNVQLVQDPLCLCRKIWPDWRAYEKDLQALLCKYDFSSVCTFNQMQHDLSILEAAGLHHLSLIRNDGIWRTTENALYRQLMTHLNESELRIGRLAKESRSILWSRSLHRGILTLSNSVEDVLGYSPTFLSEHPHYWDDSIHPDDLNLFAAAFKNIEQGKRIEIEYRIKSKSGDWVWLRDRSFAAGESENGDSVIEGLSEDVTRIKALEKDLSESKKIFSETQQVAHVGSWEWKIDEDTLIWSDEAYRQFGFKPNEIDPCYKTFENFVHPDDLEMVNRSIEKAVAGKQAYSVEARMIKKNGSEWIMHAHGTVFRDETGKIRFIGTTQDITERKIAERKLLESEEKYRQIFSTVPDSLILFDAESLEFLDVNDAFLNLYGYSKDEYTTIKMTDITSEPEKTLVAVNELIGTKVIRIPIRYHRKKDGTIFSVEISSSSFLLNKRPIICCAIRDITERKKEEKRLLDSELQLQEQKKALEQKNIALREIIAQVETEKRKISETLITNVDMVIRPILTRLKQKKALAKYADLINHHLDGLLSSHGILITHKRSMLSPREFEICNLVKAGLSNKDISHLLSISPRTVEKHRENIRIKLGLSNADVNLISYLRDG